MGLFILKFTHFEKELAALRKFGGIPAKAAEQADAIIGRMAHQKGDPASFGNLTKNGETRIDYCYKYDLAGNHRLVTVQHQENIFLLFIGKHEKVELWLNENKGLKVVVDKKTKRIGTIYENKLDEVAIEESHYQGYDSDKHLIDKLSDEATKVLCAISDECNKLKGLTVISSNEELLEAFEGVLDKKLQAFLRDLALTLRDKEVESAEAHIRKFNDDAALSTDAPELLQAAAKDPVNADAIIDLRDLSPEEFQQVLSRTKFQEWMLYLHPDQRSLTSADYAGPVLLRGVSGSGKTCVLVHRASYLANKYPSERILVVTLNPALASLIQGLIQDLRSGALCEQIHVASMGDLCRRILEYYEPQVSIPIEIFSTGTSLHALVEAQQLEQLAPIMESLKNARKVDALRYLRDEFTWIRSAFRRDDHIDGSIVPLRDKYLDTNATPRVGRAIPFAPEWRQRVLNALSIYEKRLERTGEWDAPAIALQAHRHVGKLKKERPYNINYRAILVDEVQDLGTIELEILSALAKPLENGMFLAGDLGQQVFPKQHSLSRAGIVSTQLKYFRRNYRNPRQILEAGWQMLSEFGSSQKEEEDEIQILNPEYSSRECAPPLVINADSEDQEIRYIARLIIAGRELEAKPIVIVASGIGEDDMRSMKALKDRYDSCGLKVNLLRRDSEFHESDVFLSPLETVKGFEFSTVIISQCSEETIPIAGLPQEEHWRDARRLYVAMTRARDELILTHVGKPSRFLEAIRSKSQFRTATEEGVEAGSASPESESPLQSLEKQLDREMERLRRENQLLKEGIHFKVSEKGAVSVYGLGKFPVTLYREQWEKVLGYGPAIEGFIRSNEAKLNTKILKSQK